MLTQQKMTYLSDLLLLVKQLDDGVGPPHILDGKARVPRWSLALDERRDLGKCFDIQVCHVENNSIEYLNVNNKAKFLRCLVIYLIIGY